MEWKEFIVELTKALAWPLIIVVGVALLKDRLAELLPRLEKFKHRDTEIEFASAIYRIEKGADVLKAEGQDIEIELEQEAARLKEVSVIAPRSAIQQANAVLDKYLYALLIENISKDQRKAMVVPESYEILEQLGFEKVLFERIEELRKALQITTENPKSEFTQSQIHSYIDLSIGVANSLAKKLANKTIQPTQ